MPRLVDILKTVHGTVHDFDKVKPKRKYSEPKIYTGGVDVSKWNKLSKEEQKKALSKQWYLYYSYRNPETGKLERQDNIKDGNYYKTKEERLEFLETLKRNLSRLLKQGYNPFDDTKDVEEIMSVENAIEFALDIKRKTTAENSYIRFKSRINRFKTYLFENGYSHRFMTSVDKKIVMKYLNHVLDTSSPRNRNNTRTDISSLFQVLEDNDIIPLNFVSKINVLKAPPKRNKTYSNDKLELIYEYLAEKDPQLLLFIKFVSYNFLRPVEVCRLRVGDINIKEKTLTVKAKNKPLKQKIIPKILLDQLPDLSEYSKDDFIFSYSRSPGKWDATDDNRRDHFTKRFKSLKDFFSKKSKTDDKYFKLGIEYNIYSFRHTFITKLYREIRKEMTPFETKSKLMLITGHSTMTALEKYLRDIDAELPEDYSNLIK
ncbi:integrase [Formosa sp. Hel1_33_131]|uniref:tyrosine-type recombinase/integrase n=1 Tax=Formosa sp. Hel1_33_131 TaxID=1336794 RepID=UPI00084E2FF2|nr:site-specific integrase [Formosa sp. Hel1_33_131]AOR28705.1 integrase [Formosa sp. Hel1_33_131]